MLLILLIPIILQLLSFGNETCQRIVRRRLLQGFIGLLHLRLR